MVSKMAAIPTVTIDTQIKETSMRKMSVVPTLSRTLSLSVSDPSAVQRRISRNELRISMSLDTQLTPDTKIKKPSRVRFNSASTVVSEETVEQEGRAYTKSSLRKPTGMPQSLKVPEHFASSDSVFDQEEDTDHITNFETEFGAEIIKDTNSHKQNWSEVDHVAWVLLITIAIECFIEGKTE